MLLPAMVLPLIFTSCDEDRDDNPTTDFSHVGEQFVLNTPANAENNTYDLASAQSLQLTCSQPNYGTGVPYFVRYYVQASIDPAFEKDTTVAHTELTTAYTSAKMDVNASELNDAVVKLFKAANPDEANVPVMPVYLRLRANIAGSKKARNRSFHIFICKNISGRIFRKHFYKVCLRKHSGKDKYCICCKLALFSSLYIFNCNRLNASFSVN